MQAALLQGGLLVKTRLVSWPFRWDLHCWCWRPSCPCLHICQRWLDIGGRDHKLIALPSGNLAAQTQCRLDMDQRWQFGCELRSFSANFLSPHENDANHPNWVGLSLSRASRWRAGKAKSAAFRRKGQSRNSRPAASSCLGKFSVNFR